MSNIELQIKVPKTLSDVSLGQYQEYMSVVKSNEEDSNAADFLNKKALEIFCGLELKESYNLPLKSFLGILEHLNTIFSADTPLKRHFTFRNPEGVDQLMGFIPNLEKMTFGEYIDASNYFTDWANMHKLMAVLFRPVKIISAERYQIRDYQGSSMYGEAMKEMPLDIALGAQVFFYRLSMKLARGTLKFLENHQELLNKSKEILPNGGDGIQAFMLSQEEMLQDLIRHQRFHSVKP